VTGLLFKKPHQSASVNIIPLKQSSLIYPHLKQSRLGWGLPPYQVASWCIQPFGHNRHGPKLSGGGSTLFLGRRPGSPSNTKSPGLRLTSIPSGILIHPAIWPQQIWAENWGGGSAPLGKRELGPYVTQCGQGQGLPACQVSSWFIQPFGHSTPTSHTGQTYRTGQRESDSIGRTGLQMVAQKPRWTVKMVRFFWASWLFCFLFLHYFFVWFCVADKAGYLSAFWCT